MTFQSKRHADFRNLPDNIGKIEFGIGRFPAGEIEIRKIAESRQETVRSQRLLMDFPERKQTRFLMLQLMQKQSGKTDDHADGFLEFRHHVIQ